MSACVLTSSFVAAKQAEKRSRKRTMARSAPYSMHTPIHLLLEGDCSYSSVASSQLEAPVCYLKCKVHVLEEWMFLGMVKAQT